MDHEFQDVLNDVRMPDESRVLDAVKGARLEASAVTPLETDVGGDGVDGSVSLSPRHDD